MITINCDGACEPRNPGGIATFGWIAYENDRKTGQGYGIVARDCPEATNNAAEYGAVINALGWLVDNNKIGEEIEIRSDSQLVIRQVNGEYAVKSPTIIPYFLQVRELARRFNARFIWIPREENTEADALTRLAYAEAIANRRESTAVAV